MKDIPNVIDTSKAVHAYPKKSDYYKLMEIVVGGSRVSVGQSWRNENITTLEVLSGEVNAAELRGQLTTGIEKFDAYTALWPMYVNLANLESSSMDIIREHQELAELKNEFKSHIYELAREKNLLIDEINTLKKDIKEFKAEVVQDQEFLESLDAEISALESPEKPAPEKETDPFKIAKGIFEMDKEKYLQIRDEL